MIQVIQQGGLNSQCDSGVGLYGEKHTVDLEFLLLLYQDSRGRRTNNKRKSQSPNPSF